MLGDAKIKPKRRSEWIFWWRVDQDELQDQVAKYDTLGWFDAARKLSVLCLLFSAAITAVLVISKTAAAGAFADAALFLILAAFIYWGHRWAMIAAMALWTFEKIMAAMSGLGPMGLGVVTMIFSVLWWAVYMHAFYLAFRVEQRRKKPAEASDHRST